MHANTRLRARGAPARPALRRRLRRRRGGRLARRGRASAMVREQYAQLAREAGDEGLLREVEALGPRVFELSRVPGRRARRGGRRRGVPAPRHLPPDVPRAARAAASATRRCGCCAASRGLELVELPEAASCCGFGGTFAVKNADTSAAMLTDKLRARARHGRRGRVRRGQLVPACTSAAACRASAAGSAPCTSPRSWRRAMTRRRAPVPGGGPRGAGRRPAAPQPAHARRRRSARSAPRSSPRSTTGRRCARPGAAIKARGVRHLDRHLERARGGGDRARRRRALGARRRGGQRDRRAGSCARPARTRSSRSSRWPPTRSGSTTALAARGIAALETDLAELIIQLAHDRPSHILVPAIHRNREEIRGALPRRPPRRRGPERRPAELAEVARRFLRAKFLTVGVGVSGANFAVAETGTVCVVESEGNGRMCTTLPHTLITVMGIEKVVPRARRPRGDAAAAAAVVDRRADEPLHVAVDRA